MSNDEKFSNFYIICSLYLIFFSSFLLSILTLIISFILSKKYWEWITICMLTKSMTWGGIPVAFQTYKDPLIPSWGTWNSKTSSKEARTWLNSYSWKSSYTPDIYFSSSTFTVTICTNNLKTFILFPCTFNVNTFLHPL